MRRRAIEPDEALLEISPEGALAARTVWVLLVLSGPLVIAAAWDELWRRCGAVMGECVQRAAGAMLVVVLAIAAVVVGLAIRRRVGRRVRDRDGSSRYVWALGAFFAFGLILAAPRIPAWTCDRGRFDPVLELCLHPPTTSEAMSWMPLKQAVVGGGLVGGVAIAANPRHVRWLAPLTAAAWTGGLGWLLIDTLV